ncbi:MAG: hypothetical protein PSN37_03195, partial [Alphaproteobacteria bacterium]|nr:hypothetical protein [Alphaproteobacteria bacterium]
KTLRLSATIEIYPIFASIYSTGKSFRIKESTVVTYSTSNFDIVMVLDNSRSMQVLSDQGIPRIDELKKASIDFLNFFLSSSEGIKGKGGNVQVGIVPFGSVVNVGSKYKNASWMDTSAISPIHSENFFRPKNRFELYNILHETWPGCVEVRPQPYDVLDYDPSPVDMLPEERALKTKRSARFFVPWFFPDEPDQYVNITFGARILPMFTRPFTWVRGNSQYQKSYLNDDILIVPRELKVTYNNKEEKKWHVERWFKRSKMLRKYDPKNRIASVLTGPGTGCRGLALPLSDLTNNKKFLTKEIKKMSPSGSFTNILQGLTWGWRILTPGEPFTKGNKSPDTKRFIVLLTDGVHNLPMGERNPHLRGYSAFGYGYNNRLRVDNFNFEDFHTTSKRNVDQFTRKSLRKLDLRLLKACKNVKKDGVVIFIVGYGSALRSQRFTDLLKECAFTPEHYFSAYGVSLKTIFFDIAKSISKLHISK